MDKLGSANANTALKGTCPGNVRDPCRKRRRRALDSHCRQRRARSALWCGSTPPPDRLWPANRGRRAAACLYTASPKYPLRGHQLGYRPKTNAYDAWTVEMWEQYIRDLAVFGTNAIEIVPPRSDDEPDSPLFPLPPAQMMVEMSRIADVTDWMFPSGTRRWIRTTAIRKQ